MRAPRVFVPDSFEDYLIRSLAPRVESLFLPKPARGITRAGVLLICILSMVGCQPSLWGAPPPPPTFAAPTPSATIQIPTLAPTITPMPPIAAPTPVVLNAAQVWTSPSTPQLLRDQFVSWGFQVLATRQDSANLFIDVVQTSEGAMHVSTWTYALVAPFPTLIDGVTSQELLAVWGGSSFGPFAGIPILMEESTLATFTSLWGAPAEGAVQALPADQILDAAWNQMPSLAIIPFEQIEPKWKVLMIDDQSPIQKKFDPIIYPLTVNYRLMCVEQCQVPGGLNFSYQNRDPNKLATVIMTGVTALVRATAKTMDTKGITYPGEVIRDLLLEADITHINNEVPFFTGCPSPDPNQEKQIFCSSTRYMELLTYIGTDVIELSGDHFADYRAAAMYETLDIYRQFNIPYYGGGYNVEDGRKPLLMEANGNKIMFIGCNYKTIYASATDTVPGAVPCDFDYMTEQIAYYRSQGYLPISTYQYHEFDSPEARPQQKIDFRRMADAGAVIVSGSQAHVPQVMEFHNGGFIHYGLGNLFFDQISPRGPRLTEREFIDRHVFYDGRYLGVELFTAWLTDYARPRYMTQIERDRFLEMYFEESGWDFPQAGR
ncbi:MAG: CapA family protein [Chloroflexi bacterium]|nr:CapA family protein [Chloroflexota bacterium]